MGMSRMETRDETSVHPKFVIYVPNSRLTAFHNRSPWLMLPRAFRELAYEPILICAELATKCPEGVQLFQTGLTVKAEGYLTRRGLLRSLIEPLLAFHEIARRKPDLVIFSPLRSSLATLLVMVVLYRLVSSRSTRFILKTDYGFDETSPIRVISLLSHGLVALSSRVLDMVSVETSCGVERAKRIPWVARQKVVRVPLGFPKGCIEPKTYEEVARDPVILCVARIARMKGQDVLLRAFSMLTTKYPQWSIRLVGPEQDVAFKQELIEYAVTHDLKNKVTFLGSVEERVIDSEYRRASIFCLPSVHSESAGQVKYEATACGLPVVTTDVPCGRDALEMGWRLARAGDVASLATQLDVLMNDEDERRRVVAHAQSLQIPYEDVASLYIRELGRFETHLPLSPQGG